MAISIRNTLKFVLPVAVIAASVIGARIIGANGPVPQTRNSEPAVAVVEATRLQSTRFPVIIRSQGTVQPTLANTLVPAVDGSITIIEDRFVVGATFRRGDRLFQIDPRDYEIALTQAQANYAETDAQLQEQQALANEAENEWQALGRGGEPSPLTLRVPQLAAAKANRAAALAQVQRAELDLQRTTMLAPYDGIVSERNIDPGQFVSRGTVAGRIHATQSVDVRLPLSNRQLTYLALPSLRPAALNTSETTPVPDSLTTDSGSEQSGPAATGSSELPEVQLQALIGGEEHLWKGEVIRDEGIDAATQQFNVVARIDNPYTQSDRPLRVGQFVQARIAGDVLQGVFVIPRSALREQREVLIIDENNQIQRRSVTVAWSDDTHAAINEGLANGDVLVTTPMSTVANGTPVRATIDGVAPEPLES